ncbi:MAG: AAA family ATPase, partial [Chloroflexia bacterium]|nr:AAA family ATPase [Chloroflexia bacterium]
MDRWPDADAAAPARDRTPDTPITFPTASPLLADRGTPASLEELRPDHFVPLSSFIGRKAETAAVVVLLRRDEARLVTLTGPGGVGKTRLALRVADAIADEFADGAAVVSLAAVRNADLVVPAIARAHGLPERRNQPPDRQLLAFLRDRQLLLVLDNLEHVADAAPAIAALLQGAPRLTILVTSRAPLHLSGERLFVVPPLALPRRSAMAGGQSPLPPLSELAAVEAVQLFVARARDVGAGFDLTEENAAA